MDSKPFATVKVSKLKRIISAWEAIKNKNNSDEDLEMTMEYLIVSCFPDLWKNFQSNIKDYYTKGYMEGYKDAEAKYENCT